MTTDTYPAMNQTYTINGAIWAFLPSTDPTGSGVFESFLRVAQGGEPHERGYNTDGRPLQFDEKTSATFTHSYLLSGVPIVEYNGLLYREFQVDLNEAASTPYISLDQFQVWVTNNASILGYNETSSSFTSGATLVYDLDVGASGDSTIMMDYAVNTGSGKRDYKVLVPQTMFDGKTGAYVVLFTRHGNYDAVYNGIDTGNADSNFEEWGVAVYDTKSGVKFNDRDRDCVQDIGEPGLAGWKIYADLNANGSWDSSEPYATTNSSGGYIIYNIAKPEKGNTFIVREVLQNGWTQSCPASGYYEDTWVGGAVHGGNNFGNYRCCLDIIRGSINACYLTQAAAEAAAIAATTVSDNCSGVAPNVTASTVGTCNAVITVTATDACGDSLNVTYNTKIASAVSLNVPGNSTASACTYANQAAANAAFTAWLGQANYSGGCNASISDNHGSAPAFCGGNATVTWTVTSSCENVTKGANFKVDAPAAVNLNVPGNSTASACTYVNQAAVDTAFATWLTGANFTGGCGASIHDNHGSAPSFCGGNATVTWTVNSTCEGNVTKSANFKVDAPAAINLTVPGNFTAPACYGNQTAVQEAFDAWVASANVTGGCNPIKTDDHGTAPSRCGGNATVTWNATSSCENVTKSATFTIPAGCCVSCGTACAANGTAGQVLFGGAQNNWFTYITYNKGEGNATSPKQYPIFAGQTQRVGTLYVYNNSTRLFVRYCADPGLGVGITSYHLEVVDEFSGFNGIRTKSHGVYGNPVPGRCEYSGNPPGMPACSDWIVSVNDNISNYGDNDIYIFAHSIMCWSQD